MERVAFLIEDSGRRLSCLLNPESFTMRRQAGLRPSRAAGGMLVGSGMKDDPLISTGGGRTELTLDLLFDISLLHGDASVEDVRELTACFHDLAENQPHARNLDRPPLVRFVWGKSWNLPCVVSAVAERFESFSAAGMPRRSWMRMRLVRLDEDAAQARTTRAAPTTPLGLRDDGIGATTRSAGMRREEGRATLSFETIGSGPNGPTDRLDRIAYERYGHPGYWRAIAQFNDLDRPDEIAPGTVLQLPPESMLEGRG